MSLACLLLATRDHLRTTLILPNSECDVQEGGQPPASAGERYIAVSEGEWQSNSFECLDEYMGAMVTVSLRTSRFPGDKLGTAAMTELAVKSGLIRLGEFVRAAIHSNYDLMNAANDYIGSSFNGFVEPLRLAGPGHIRPVGPEWYQAEADADSPAIDGLVLVMPFSRARRIQSIENQLGEFNRMLLTPQGSPLLTPGGSPLLLP